MKLKALWVIVLMSVAAVEAKAYDFAVAIGNGDSLFFSITDRNSRHVMVVYPSLVGANYYYGHRQPSGTVVIPGSVAYNGQRYEVTAIGERAFSGCNMMQLVTMPATMQEIGAYAFYGCTGLKGRVSIGPNVKRIGASAFYGCTFLPEVNFRATDCTYMGGSVSMTVFGNCLSLKKVIIDQGVRRIPDFAFCGVDAITDSVSLPSSLRHIGAYAFAYCNGLGGTLTIPDSVETVGECAFHQCHSLKALVIGASVKQIGLRAFYHCVGLKRIIAVPLVPATIDITTFADIPKTAKLCVPCVSRKLYSSHDLWKKLGVMESFGDCTFTVDATMDSGAAGTIVGGGQFAYGDSVSLMAVCASGFGFDRWSDGNLDNPRRFAATDNMVFMAMTRPSGTVIITDTLYRVDTVYAEGYKVIHDTVDLVEVARPIASQKELSFDTDKKRLTWNFPRQEKVVSVTLYNQAGECVFAGDGHKGKINMRRLPSGSYIVRIETIRRVVRCRLFMNADRTWSGIDREMSVQ